MTISICICTKDRPLQLSKCIYSILKGGVLPDEIIIINEGRSLDKNLTPQSPVTKINIINYPVSNLSKGRNYAISMTQSEIICFTDDDCLVDFNWVKECLRIFKSQKACMAVFGNTKPYQPDKNISKNCPCTLELNNQTFISKPCYHATKIGFGNNMAFRKKIFSKIGNFKNWLGVGSIGLSAEDAEFALSILINKFKIIHNPQMRVLHNKWYTNNQIELQNLSYICGEMACYGYFYFKGHIFAKLIVVNNIRNSYFKIRNILKNVLLLRWNKPLISAMSHTFAEILYQARGLMVGFIYSQIDPVR